MTTTFDELLKQHNDLCLRVSRNHDDVSAIARSEIHPTRRDLANLSYRTNQLEKKVEKIDTVLDHDTDSMLLSNLCKRVTDLELVAQIRSKVVEPSVEVIIRDQTVPLDEIKRACLMLGATRVVVDAGGIGATLLRYLQADGLPAVAMVKPEKAWWKS